MKRPNAETVHSFYVMLTRTVYFFFSSRRRHTRLQGDWSSDVCSSDLSHSSLPSGISRFCERTLSRDARSTFSSMASRSVIRSEEHTSELQSPCNLVCRLLLEKKKKK